MIDYVFYVPFWSIMIFCGEHLLRLFCLIAAILTLKLVVLPITYNYMEHNSNSIIVQKFIVKLKNSILAKLLILVIALMPTFIYYTFVCENMSEFVRKIPTAFLISLICGAFGSYTVLFIYWYVRKKYRQNSIIEKISNLIFNKYSIIALICANFCMIILVFTAFKKL